MELEQSGKIYKPPETKIYSPSGGKGNRQNMFVLPFARQEMPSERLQTVSRRSTKNKREGEKMTVKECKRRIDGLSLYLTIAKNSFEIPACVDRAAVKLVESLISSVNGAYDQAVSLGWSHLYAVRKPLNRARFEIGRIIKEYERREEKAAKELLRVYLRLGGKK